VQVPGCQAAIGEHFNVCSDRYITFEGIVKTLAAAAGVEPGIMLYDPAAVKLDKGEGFPFRTAHFFAQVRSGGCWRALQAFACMLLSHAGEWALPMLVFL
jgi:hypothetical protein